MSAKTITVAMATTAVLVGVGVAPAQAAPLQVQQIALRAIQAQAVYIPEAITTRVGASTTKRIGLTRLTANVTSVSGYASYGSAVRIDFRNLRTGVRGSVTVTPFSRGQIPRSALAWTGTGRIAFTASFVNVGRGWPVAAPTPGTGWFYAP